MLRIRLWQKVPPCSLPRAPALYGPCGLIPASESTRHQNNFPDVGWVGPLVRPYQLLVGVGLLLFMKAPPSRSQKSNPAEGTARKFTPAFGSQSTMMEVGYKGDQLVAVQGDREPEKLTLAGSVRRRLAFHCTGEMVDECAAFQRWLAQIANALESGDEMRVKRSSARRQRTRTASTAAKFSPAFGSQRNGIQVGYLGDQLAAIRGDGKAEPMSLAASVRQWLAIEHADDAVDTYAALGRWLSQLALALEQREAAQLALGPGRVIHFGEIVRSHLRQPEARFAPSWEITGEDEWKLGCIAAMLRKAHGLDRNQADELAAASVSVYGLRMLNMAEVASAACA